MAMERDVMSKLITGGTGFVGAQLAHILVDRGEDVVLFDVAPNWGRIRDIGNKLKVVSGSLSNWPEVLNVVKENNIKGIYHLGGMLSIPSDENPWASFQANVCGTMHILEAARLFNVGRVVFTSSLATYGLGIPRVVTDETLQRPTSMYGCGKLYSELLGRFYRAKFGLDFRSVRYPTLVGPGVLTPGVTQYNALMIEHAALGKPYECYVTEDTKSAGFMYFRDAVRAVDMLYQAPEEQIQMVNYNVSGLRAGVAAKELEQIIRKYVPEASVSYKPDKEAVALLQNYKDTMQVIDDTKAREEWSWEPLYQDIEKVVEDFIQEVRTRPERYGITR